MVAAFACLGMGRDMQVPESSEGATKSFLAQRLARRQEWQQEQDRRKRNAKSARKRKSNATAKSRRSNRG